MDRHETNQAEQLPGDAGQPPVPPPASPFLRFGDADIVDLIGDYPLAWLCPAKGGDAGLPSLLPLLPEIDADGRLVGLIGHMAKRNPLYAALSGDPAALVLFTGPQAYVSPGLVTDPAWAPTWNYAQLRIAGTVAFDPERGHEALAMLVEAMDRHAGSGWTVAMMGERYAPMEQAIIAFHIAVTRIEGKFKLGQDESPERLREIVAGHPDPALVAWMERFNPGRF
ncbi:hypothetical protein GCM10009087_28840 [Sphingomonas oligophenolica]|uniref:FMN-binding negative transcriptional regulator n=1 Tax=Sphingomonas oligophenolica TaxID=301154 RepID=A0ABU9Y8G7_9SPHN